jgi:hypothetical protein
VTCEGGAGCCEGVQRGDTGLTRACRGGEAARGGRLGSSQRRGWRRPQEGLAAGQRWAACRL